MDWSAFVFGRGGEEYESLRRIAEQRFWYDPTLAEEAFSYAFETVNKDDWSRISRFKGNSSPRTFLISTFQNCLEDFSRRVYGRIRPPKWIVDLGGAWVDAHEWLCMQRIDSREVAARLAATDRVKSESEAVSMVRAIRAGLPRCGEGVGPTRSRLEDDDSFDATLVGGVLHPEAASACESGNEAEAALLAISTLLGLVESPMNRLELRAISSLCLSDEDIVMLRLVYVENESVTACAQILGEQEHTIRRRIRRLHERLADALRAEGFTGTDA